METYFRESGAIGLPTIKVIGSTENALRYAQENGLEWMPPDDRCIEKTIELG